MCGICGCDEISIDHRHDDSEHFISIEQDVLSKNNQFSAHNKNFFEKRGILAINLISSPGSGKTTLLVNTLQVLKNTISIAVIEGDQHTDLDAMRIRETNVPVLQINTGKLCHLDAHQIGHAVEELNVADNSLLFIENVGNLICPALFDLGEAYRVVILSVTEGEDKPLKYPEIFRQAHLLIINKIDLLPYVEFDVENCIKNARKINPDLDILQVSATRNLGLEQWHQWIVARRDLAEILKTNMLQR